MPFDIMQGWSNFFVAELGAAAALTGLLFVAVSINLSRILQLPHLPTRAAEALLSLFSVLFVTSFALIPRQSLITYGIEIGATGLLSFIFQTIALVRTEAQSFRVSHARYTASRRVLRILANQLPPIPFVISGILLTTGHPSSVYWIVPGVLLSFAASVLHAWILLVEINR
jgi:hypothetical protein